MKRVSQEWLNGESRVRGPHIISSIHADSMFSSGCCGMVQVKDMRPIARCITLGLATNGPSVALPGLVIVGSLKYGDVPS